MHRRKAARRAGNPPQEQHFEVRGMRNVKGKSKREDQECRRNNARLLSICVFAPEIDFRFRPQKVKRESETKNINLVIQIRAEQENTHAKRTPSTRVEIFFAHASLDTRAEHRVGIGMTRDRARHELVASWEGERARETLPRRSKRARQERMFPSKSQTRT